MFFKSVVLLLEHNTRQCEHVCQAFFVAGQRFHLKVRSIVGVLLAEIHTGFLHHPLHLIRDAAVCCTSVVFVRIEADANFIQGLLQFRHLHKNFADSWLLLLRKLLPT